MSNTTFFIIFIPILSILLLFINLLLALHNPYQEKNSAFECGFNSFLGQNRTQFSVSFFIFALLFLLFDLEILLVYPYSVSGYNNDIYGLIIMMIFFGLLTLGFIFELGKNALSIDSKQISLYNNTDVPKEHIFMSSVYAPFLDILSIPLPLFDKVMFSVPTPLLDYSWNSSFLLLLKEDIFIILLVLTNIPTILELIDPIYFVPIGLVLIFLSSNFLSSNFTSSNFHSLWNYKLHTVFPCNHPLLSRRQLKGKEDYKIYKDVKCLGGNKVMPRPSHGEGMKCEACSQCFCKKSTCIVCHNSLTNESNESNSSNSSNS